MTSFRKSCRHCGPLGLLPETIAPFPLSELNRNSALRNSPTGTFPTVFFKACGPVSEANSELFKLKTLNFGPWAKHRPHGSRWSYYIVIHKPFWYCFYSSQPQDGQLTNTTVRIRHWCHHRKRSRNTHADSLQTLDRGSFRKLSGFQSLALVYI